MRFGSLGSRGKFDENTNILRSPYSASKASSDLGEELVSHLWIAYYFKL